MKVLFIVDDYLPHSIKVAAKMMHELAIEFKKNGHEVTVLTPYPNQKEDLIFESLDGITILYFRSGALKNISKTSRAINETLLSKRAWTATKEYFKQNHYEGIVYYSPSIFWGLLVKKLRTLWNCGSYLILRDIFPQWTVDNGLMNKNSPVYWYFKYFERTTYRNAETIGVMSPSNYEFFRKQYNDVSKFEVLYNWSAMPKIPENMYNFRKKLNLENKIILFYGGNIGHAQKMIYLIDLAKQLLNNDDVHFLFVGKGDEVEMILAKKEKHKLANITYLPSVDQETYFKLLNEVDIGLFSLHPDHKTHNFPGKLLGYMGYSKPILGCVNSGNDLKEIVNSAKAGFVVNSGNNEELYAAAKKLIESAKLRKEMGENGRRLLADQFSVHSACKQIEAALLHLYQ